MTDQRVSFLGAVSSQTRAELLGILNRTEISISVAPETLATTAGQTIVYQLATLTARLFDHVKLIGDEGTVARSTRTMLAGPFLEAVRRTCS
jgi:hypothetical protein